MYSTPLHFSTFSLIVMILFFKDVLGRESHVRILKSNLLNLVFVILLMGSQILPYPCLNQVR